MSAEPTPYQPISCDFHDLLEGLATTRRKAAIAFVGPEGAVVQVESTIVDIVTRDGAEYLKLANGEWLRLDRLVSVDPSRLADFR